MLTTVLAGRNTVMFLWFILIIAQQCLLGMSSNLIQIFNQINKLFRFWWSKGQRSLWSYETVWQGLFYIALYCVGVKVCMRWHVIVYVVFPSLLRLSQMFMNSCLFSSSSVCRLKSSAQRQKRWNWFITTCSESCSFSMSSAFSVCLFYLFSSCYTRDLLSKWNPAYVENFLTVTGSLCWNNGEPPTFTESYLIQSGMAAQKAADSLHSLTWCRLATTANLIASLWASGLNEKDYKSWRQEHPRLQHRNWWWLPAMVCDFLTF